LSIIDASEFLYVLKTRRAAVKVLDDAEYPVLDVGELEMSLAA